MIPVHIDECVTSLDGAAYRWTYTYPSPLADAVRALEWTGRGVVTGFEGHCPWCNGNRDKWVEVRPDEREGWYRLEAGHHDTWCPWLKVAALLGDGK